eukprot:6798462-Prymnesium_polylepis.1
MHAAQLGRSHPLADAGLSPPGPGGRRSAGAPSPRSTSPHSISSRSPGTVQVPTATPPPGRAFARTGSKMVHPGTMPRPISQTSASGCWAARLLRSCVTLRSPAPRPGSNAAPLTLRSPTPRPGGHATPVAHCRHSRPGAAVLNSCFGRSRVSVGHVDQIVDDDVDGVVDDDGEDDGVLARAALLRALHPLEEGELLVGVPVVVAHGARAMLVVPLAAL